MQLPEMRGDAADGLDGNETSGRDLKTAATTFEVESGTLIKNERGNQVWKMSSCERTPSTPTTAADDDLVCSPSGHSFGPFGETDEQEIGEDTHSARAAEAQSTDRRQVEDNLRQAENRHVERRKEWLVLGRRGSIRQQHAHPARAGGMECL